MAELRVRIQLKTKTTEQWASTPDEVLLRGEVGVELGADGTANKFKIGDGTSKWSELKYTYDLSAIMSAVDEKLAGVGSKMEVYEASVENGGDKVSALQLVATEPEQGDVGIVSEDIAGGAEKQLTAFVYTGTEWKALDGNYNAGNVYFDKDLVITAQLGVQKPDASGSKTLSTKGKNVQQVFDLISAQDDNPSITQPRASITLTGAGAKEVGTEFTPSFSASLNPGEYQYGPATGVTATSYTVTDTKSHSADTASGSFDTFTVGDGENYNVRVTIAHTEGAIPKTTLGNNYEAGKISAGSKTASSSAVTGYRAFFYGAKTAAVTIDSSNIRALTNGGAFKTSFSLTFEDGIKQVIIALPNGHTLKKVEDTGAFGTDIVGSFVLQTAQVEGLNRYTAAEYNVYVYAPAAALGKNKYNITCA